MDYSTFLDEQLKEKIKQARIQIDILDQQETDMMSELSHRKAARLAQHLQKVILGEQHESVDTIFSNLFND